MRYLNGIMCNKKGCIKFGFGITFNLRKTDMWSELLLLKLLMENVTRLGVDKNRNPKFLCVYFNVRASR